MRKGSGQGKVGVAVHGPGRKSGGAWAGRREGDGAAPSGEPGGGGGTEEGRRYSEAGGEETPRRLEGRSQVQI